MNVKSLNLLRNPDASSSIKAGLFLKITEDLELRIQTIILFVFLIQEYSTVVEL